MWRRGTPRHTAAHAAREAEIQQWWDNVRWATDLLLAAYEEKLEVLDNLDVASAVSALDYFARTSPEPDMEEFAMTVLEGATLRMEKIRASKADTGMEVHHGNA